jgi:hypothetical protein
MADSGPMDFKRGYKFMKSVGTLFLFLLLSASTTLAMSAPDQVFRDLENKVLRASEARNIAEMDTLLAPEYISVGTSGKIRSKKQIIEEYSNGSFAIRGSTEDNVTVRQFAETAILVGFITVSGKVDGADISGRYAFTRVYERSDDRWRAVSFQTTLVK